MKWSSEVVLRLFDAYLKHFNELRANVSEANRCLGSKNPEMIRLTALSVEQLEALIRQRTDEPEVLRLWLRRITRGRDRDFPGLLTELEPRKSVG